MYISTTIIKFNTNIPWISVFIFYIFPLIPDMNILEKGFDYVIVVLYKFVTAFAISLTVPQVRAVTTEGVGTWSAEQFMWGEQLYCFV